MRIETVLSILTLIVLTTSRTVQWTNAGGNPQWEYAANWDCNCAPSLLDDVVINVPNIAGIVRISNVAFAKSLTVGGSGGLPQTLTVQGQLTINGDTKIFPNGFFILDAAPSQPLTVSGLFDGTDRFRFNSGTLNGTGSFSFTYVNFTSAALKAINASTTVSTLLFVDPGPGNEGTINIQSKILNVNGNLTTSQALDIYSNPGGLLNVKGYLVSMGSSVTSSIIRGDATITNLINTGGVITLNDNVTITLASIGSGATLSLIGSGISTRNIGNIIGLGVLQVQGGTNVFGTLSGISSVNFQGGTLSTNSNTATIGNLVQTGGILTGTGTITIGSVTLTNAQITNPTVSVANLNLQGFTGLSNAQLVLTGMAVIGKDSQFTMSNGAVFTVSAAAKVSQSAMFQLLPSGSNQPPSFTNNGVWTTTVGTLNVVVNTAGTGSFQFGSSSTLSLNGIAFNTQRVTLTGSKLVVTGSVVSINTIDGSNGNITAGGRQFFCFLNFSSIL